MSIYIDVFLNRIITKNETTIVRLLELIIDLFENKLILFEKNGIATELSLMPI